MNEIKFLDGNNARQQYCRFDFTLTLDVSCSQYGARGRFHSDMLRSTSALQFVAGRTTYKHEITFFVTIKKKNHRNTTFLDQCERCWAGGCTMEHRCRTFRSNCNLLSLGSTSVDESQNFSHQGFSLNNENNYYRRLIYRISNGNV